MALRRSRLLVRSAVHRRLLALATALDALVYLSVCGRRSINGSTMKGSEASAKGGATIAFRAGTYRCVFVEQDRDLNRDGGGGGLGIDERGKMLLFQEPVFQQ